MFPLFLILVSLLGGEVARAGVWTGGGGEIVRDAFNPWYVQNTERVRYCVASGEHFSLDHQRAVQRIEQAFSFWKSEFQRLEYTLQPDRPVPPARRFGARVATQQFQRVSCMEPHDLIFQLGVILSDEQRRYLGDVSQVVGVAVRTDYDRVQLRAKGFIYIGADSGADRIDVGQGSQREHRWAADGGDGFYEVIVHELGHVFGLPHLDHINGFSSHLMSARMPETVVRRGPGYASLSLDFDLEDGGKLWKFSLDNCPLVSRFFRGSASALTALRLVPADGGQKFVVELTEDEWRPDRAQSFHRVGEIILETDVQLVGLSVNPLVNVLLSPEDSVFGGPIFSSEIPVFVPGVGMVTRRLSGTYVSDDGSMRRPAMLRIVGARFELGGLLDGRIVQDFFTTGCYPFPD